MAALYRILFVCPEAASNVKNGVSYDTKENENSRDGYGVYTSSPAERKIEWHDVPSLVQRRAYVLLLVQSFRLL